MDNTTLMLLIAVGMLAVVFVAYVIVQWRARPASEPTPQPTPEAVEAPAPAEGLAPPAPPAPAPAPPPAAVAPPVVASATPQFFELLTIDNKLVRLPLDKTWLSIGRAPDNDIVLDERFPGSETIADHHARVELRSDLVIIEDLNSASGLFVNDRRTGKNLLRNGWRLGLGDVELVFRTLGLGTAPLSLPESSRVSIGGEPARPLRDSRPFAALPEGALIGDRYAVIETREEMPHLNVYVVENLDAVRRCSQCGCEENGVDQLTCLDCSASLQDAMPYYPHHLIKETDDPGMLEVEAQLVGFAHPAALLPRQVWDETPYGTLARRYLIGPDLPRYMAATVQVPQKVTDVLEWGVQLAEGLAYLHQAGVVMGAIDVWRVGLDGRLARWSDFTPCEFVQDPDSLQFADDVLGLASVLYYLMTGQREYAPPASVSPPAVAALIDQALDLKSFTSAQQFADAIQSTLIEVRRPFSVDLHVGRCSDVGQVRHLNEDSLLVLELGRIRRSISEPLGLFAIADGMGGHAAGDVASALTVDTLARKAVSELWMEYLLESGALSDIGTWLKLAVQEANQAVFGRRRASTSDMGTTLVVALVQGVTATIAHAGDSRAYLIDADGIRQVTTDHSLVQRLIQLGQLTPEEARLHPQRNVIYRNLGEKPRVDPDVNEVKLKPGDQLLLCSDGLTGMVTDDKIHQVVMGTPSPQEACRELVRLANAAGGEDNISVIIIRVEALG